jgi:predicted ABC-type ATPase
MVTPRIRMFAGPNGSGKSTLKNVLSDELIGIYINADEIESEIRESGQLKLNRFELSDDAADLRAAILSNRRLEDLEIDEPKNNSLCFSLTDQHAYLASVISEEIRSLLFKKRLSFTFETVMSHVSKVELLEQAQSQGYRTYLYYVATEDPEINVSRVAYRVSQNGHTVPLDKIISRYERSLDYLLRAIRASSRAYIFDNSGAPGEQTWFAEVTDGESLEYKSERIPAWFATYVLKRTSVEPIE